MHLDGKWLCLRKEQKVMFELKTINIMYIGCVFQKKLKFVWCLEQLARAYFSTFSEKESLSFRCNYYGKHPRSHLLLKRKAHKISKERAFKIRVSGSVLPLHTLFLYQILY